MTDPTTLALLRQEGPQQEQLIAVAQSLVDFQRVYQEMAWDTAPGNEHYAGMLMKIVHAAQAALSASRTAQMNETTRLLDEERRRWYRALDWAGDLEGLAPEVAAEYVHDTVAASRTAQEGQQEWIGLVEDFCGWWGLNREGSVNAAYARIDAFVKKINALPAFPSSPAEGEK